MAGEPSADRSWLGSGPAPDERRGSAADAGGGAVGPRLHAPGPGRGTEYIHKAAPYVLLSLVLGEFRAAGTAGRGGAVPTRS